MQYIPYIVMSILAIIFGQLVGQLNKKLPPVVCEKITYKEYYKTFFTDFKIDFKYTIIFLILYNSFIYFLGNNVTSYLYTIIIVALTIVFYVDIKYQLIPDETHIIILLAGLINFILNINNWWSYLLGAFVGGAIFWLLNLLTLAILKKEGMGFGDVKLMASLGFMFGIKGIIVIALIAFFIGAIVGVFILIIKRKEDSAYMPFGPFIALGAIILMFTGAQYIIELYIIFCSFIGNKITDIIFLIMKK